MTQEIKPKSSLEIVQEMRDYMEALAANNYEEVVDKGVFLAFADDLEEAIKRERETVTPCHGMDAPQPVTPRNRFVNVSALLDALKSLVAYWDWNGYDAMRESRLKDAARAALAAPPRNCDRFSTKDEAWKAFARAYFGPTDPGFIEDAFERWLFAPAAQEGGGHADA